MALKQRRRRTRRANSLPTNVLTKDNNKSWSQNDFDQYEEQLKAQLTILKSISSTIKATNNKTKRSNSTISLNNCEEWDDEDMDKYKQDMLFQIRELMITTTQKADS
mmetsp:Transcript_71379/g.64077  ORF Transcript_71379/g.64077 Transcript_71379/m.64077 type:complete len:107 (+) Transcript_71379:31-351(+)|eukprot:CAMPEP_0201565038 /NCGR_PEP_ID=MMETSP0190_2-20130828/3861_1 /ASSEMBLY_ACC=CAM_ASM_000263 /TAXON_ID=37353 /ORGANISM="Rosalina sp." /LENGTH=106 /DNA_ID=CAMNT_0047982023 /DNA_START=24 /DNA_END=344 /DNA_ORIENTATION=+